MTVGILSYARGTIVISEILIDFALGKEYQFGCGILKMVGPKKQDFWPKINIPFYFENTWSTSSTKIGNDFRWE